MILETALQLSQLLAGIAVVAEDRLVTGLSLDSRTLVPGDVFIALAGSRQHGLTHLDEAVRKGACAVVFDPAGDTAGFALQLKRIPHIAVDHLELKLGDVAARFYGDPSRRLDVIGLTGTNGKTSCSQFLGQLLDDCGIIGTLGWGEWGKLNETLNTTPDALAVQRILAQLAAEQKKSVAMEVSSHGLEQGRVNGVRFKGAVLTNISRDHLDYHGSMEAYVQAKMKLFDKPDLSFAVVNLDDDYSNRVLATVPKNVALWGYSRQGNKTAQAECLAPERIAYQADGIEFDVRWQHECQRIRIPLFGEFNIDNVLAVLAVMLALGHSLEESARRLRSLKPVAGRMERFGGGRAPVVFVDYAHTPDAVEKVLSSVRKHCNSAVWVVLGCGGNRDRGKRPEMGAIAERWADQVILTDDNPRFEDGQAIVDDIASGCRMEKVKVIRDREKAIQTAVLQAQPDDYVVIAGKGHEQYQEINGVKLPFSDAGIVAAALNKRADQNAIVVE
ncbi:UDP-N-acetylmuramoyl-L-alanyl-D-glutamate--2,6-diaminopimelate ligase [Methylosarcina fibrata]|uniref:UDP-N-acetylmuramoyl-L-alanyl-D-glutamate--2, 6-diaminopimelate ligase n=1 Tax=Methylosarcina fibrata TaxID=105972 RepID=UPI00037A8EBE|nr:UDP-N-acetylmuramoyl-L-alanyl-D-glutamate--2,6-diaminopimelate ligase [Methylosarcina fibrata]